MDSVFCQSDLQFWFGIANLIDRPHFKPIIDQIARKCKSHKHKYQGLVFQFPQNTRVGIVNQLESHATHKNISSFATENFTKTYQVDWDIPSYAENQLISQLEKDMVCLPESCLAANLGVSLNG